MHLPVPKAGLIGLSALFALVAALAVFIYSSGSNQAEAATYAPTSAVKFCNALAADFPSSIGPDDADLVGNPACAEGAIPASTARNFTVTFSVPAGQSNFGSSVITNVPGTVSNDAAIPNGQKVGGLRSDVTLGLLNGNCATALVAEFILYDSSTSGSLAVQPEGTPNRFSTLVTDANSDGLADSTSPFVGTNPSIYNDLFTVDGGPTVTPTARYTGATIVPPVTGDWQLLSFFQVAAGATDAFATSANDEPHIFGRVSHAPATGTNSLSILNDATATAISVSPIHDFCTPLVVQTMLLGTTPGGQTRYTTPTAGTAGISNYSYGQRDADNDGKENAFDTCPLNANLNTDTDGDGIDGACDTPGGGSDVDGDGFANRQDNCPLISNGSPQLDSEQAATYISAASDGGPKTDSIGDECDPSPSTSTGQGAFVEAYNLVYKCIGGTDADGDGICAPQDTNDASACVYTSLATMKGCGFASNVGLDPEYKNSGGTVGDHGDRIGGNTEVYLGGDPIKRCGVAGAWPFDLVFNNSITISDVLALKPVFNGTVPPVDSKFDFVPNKSITISDVLALKPVFNLNCTP